MTLGGYDNVSLLELKKAAMKLLAQDSPLKSLILSEPDYLPRQEAVIKIGVYSRILEKELGPGR